MADLMLPGPHLLKEGVCYFDLVFHEDDDRFPCLETYIYVGSRRQEYFFQDVESFLKYGNLMKRPASRQPKKSGLVVVAADYVEGMFDLHGIAHALARLGSEGPSTST